MRMPVFGSIASVALLCVTAQAQQNSATRLLDSPVKSEPVYDFAETVRCNIALPSSAALFDTDTISATVDEFITNELFPPFRVWQTDSSCVLLSSWTTAFVGATMTGIAVPNGSTTQYWVIDPATDSASRYLFGGTPVPASVIPLTTGSSELWGAAVVDDNQSGQVLCINDSNNDAFLCVNGAAGGAFVCTYANLDNEGFGAFGNSIGEAVDVSNEDCSAATLIRATGTFAEGQVMRVGQYDCVHEDPVCSDRWSVGQFSTFINGVDEFDDAGDRRLAMVDNATSTFVILGKPIDIRHCQETEPNMNLVFVNGSRGTAANGYNVDVDTSTALSVAIHKTPAGNGKFVHHMNAGVPNSATVGTLFDLGSSCFPFLDGSPVVVENNAGKTGLVGLTNYFLAMRGDGDGNADGDGDPSKAPCFLQSLSQSTVDVSNLPIASQFTHQSIHLNTAASSTWRASLSNAVIMTMQ